MNRNDVTKVAFMPKEDSSWKKYYFSEIKRYAKIWWRLRSQKRCSEANRILSIYKYPPFWIPVIGILIIYGIFWASSCTQEKTEQIIETVQADSVAHIDWTSIRQAALERDNVTNFRKAKKRLYFIHANLNLEKTFYCDCEYSEKKPDLNSCGVVPRKQERRANRIEAEHIMPISLLGHTLDCWNDGGRKNCGRVNDFFKKAEADIHNLTPTVGEINGDRSNYPPVESIAGEIREYGICDVEIENKQFEPPPHRRGDIARAYLYMWKVYDAPLTNDDITMFEKWHLEDPPTDEEIQIHQAKAEVQGNINPYISQFNK